MKKIILVITLIYSINFFGQEKLVFDKRFVQSEDKWVAFLPDSTKTYSYGFIYIDAQAGLTLNYEGTFTIDEKGKFNPKKRETEGFTKVRLQPNNVKVAFIPESKFGELKIAKTPDWLKSYKTGENSIERLYNWGYMYNGWNECEKALEFLEKADKINPDYKGLGVELAFSYNCLQQYQNAITVLKKALKKEPLEAYTNKELIYAQAKLGKLDEAEKSYKYAFKNCPDKTYNAENAYNILHGYYLIKDIKKFNSWLTETESILSSNPQIKNIVEQMKIKLRG